MNFSWGNENLSMVHCFSRWMYFKILIAKLHTPKSLKMVNYNYKTSGFYMASEISSKNLDILWKYVMKVYISIWFLLKIKQHCSDRSRHLLTLINSSMNPVSDLRDIIDIVIQTNNQFALEENFLLMRLADDRNQIRELAFRLIKAEEYKSQQRIPLQNIDEKKSLGFQK